MLVRGAFFAVLAVLFLGMIGMQLLGWHFGARRLARGLGGQEGTGTIDGALFALLGLLVAFTLSGALDRLGDRRKLIVEEANAIGTAYLRLDLLPPAEQPRLREQFRRYTDSRIALYQKLLDFDVARSERQRGTELQQEIWKDALAATSASADSRASLLFVPALNQMIDLSTARAAALRTHAPIAIFVLLVLLSFACAFVAGLSMAKSSRPSRLHILMFAGILAVTAYVILNLEFPRAGLVRLGPIDALLGEVRASMN
jgi:hypothetical protein